MNPDHHANWGHGEQCSSQWASAVRWLRPKKMPSSALWRTDSGTCPPTRVRQEAPCKPSSRSQRSKHLMRRRIRPSCRDLIWLNCGSERAVTCLMTKTAQRQLSSLSTAPWRSMKEFFPWTSSSTWSFVWSRSTESKAASSTWPYLKGFASRPRSPRISCGSWKAWRISWSVENPTTNASVAEHWKAAALEEGPEGSWMSSWPRRAFLSTCWKSHRNGDWSPHRPTASRRWWSLTVKCEKGCSEEFRFFFYWRVVVFDFLCTLLMFDFL